MLSKPDLKGTPKQVLEYIEQLEKKASGLEVNGAIKFMAALNRKLNDLASDIDTMNIDLEDKDDKTLDRFLKMATAAHSLVGNFKTFTQEYGNVIQEDTSSSIPLIEKMFNKKPKDGKAL